MIIKNRTMTVLFTAVFFILSGSATDTGTLKYKLGNGLTVLLEPNNSSPMVSYCAIVKFGARNESTNNHGAAHMLEHLVFNGTASRTQEQFYKDVDLIGAYNNASTGRASTTYLMLAPSEFAEKALELQADMLLNSTLPEAKFEKEKSIIIEEIGRQYNETYYIAENYSDSELMTADGYRHPILGEKNDIRDMNREEILKYYKEYYNPANIYLKISGNFDPTVMKGWIEKYYGKAKGSVVQKAPEFKEPVFDKKLHIRRMKAVQMHYYIICLPAPGASSEELPAYLILVDMLNSKLQKVLKPDFPVPIMRIAADYVPFEKNGILELTIMTPPFGEPSIVAAAVLDYINKYAFEDLSEAHLHTKITAREVNDLISAEKPHITSFMQGQLISIAGIDIHQRISELMQFLTFDEAFNTKNKFFHPLKYTGVFVGPGSLETAEESQSAITQDVLDKAASFLPIEKLSVKAPQPAIVQPQPAEICDKKETRELTLSNGLKVAVLQSPGSPVFAVHILFKNRSSLEPEGKKGIASLLNRLLISGTSQADASQLGAIADAMGLVLTLNDNPMIPFDDIYTQPTFSFIRLETSNIYWKASLSFLYNIMYHSTFPENEFNEKKNEQLAIIKKSMSSAPDTAKSEFFKKILGENHPLAINPLGSINSVSPITKDDLVAFRNLYFAPDNMIITVSTDQPADKIINEINSLFGEEKISYIPPEVKAFSAVEQLSTGRFEIPLGKRQSYIYYGYLVPYAKDDYYPMQLAVSLISDKLSFQLREREGLAYSLSANINFYRHNALFTFTIGTGLENIEKALKGIQRELKILENYKPDEEEILKTARMYVGRLAMRTLSRINQAYYAGTGIFFFRDANYLENIKKGISEVKQHEIAKALKTIIENKEPLIVIAK